MILGSLIGLVEIEQGERKSLLFSLRDSLNPNGAFDSDNLDTLLNLLSYSRDKQILNLVLKYISKHFKDEHFLVSLIEHGAVNALISFMHQFNSDGDGDKELKLQGLCYLNQCIADPLLLDAAQIPPLALIVTNSLSLSVSSACNNFLIECINLAKKCAQSDAFCEHFLQYLSQTETARMINTLEMSIKHKLIELLIDIFSDGARTKLLRPPFAMAIMQSFSSSFRSQTSQLWLKLLIILVKDLRFAQEFMRFGCLKVLLALLKIPHMDIVFQSVRVLKVLAAHGIIKQEQYGNSTRQQLIHMLGGVKYEYEQKQFLAEEAKRAIQISKTQVAKTLMIPLPNERPKTPSQGMMLQKKEEEKRLKEDALKKAQLELAEKEAAANKKKIEILKRMEDTKKEREKQKETTKKSITKPKEKRSAEKVNSKKSLPLEKVLLPVVKEKVQRNEVIVDSEPEIMEDWKGKLSFILEQLSNPIQTQVDRLNLMIALQKVTIQYTLDDVTADKICKILVNFLAGSEETIIIVHACTISYYMLCQPELQETVFNSGVVKALCELLQGYNCLAIEHALWSLDIYCASEANINHICGLEVIESLAVVVDSSMTNIRIHAQSILSKIAKLQDGMFYQQIKTLRQKNPWSQVSMTWSDVWQIPSAQ